MNASSRYVCAFRGARDRYQTAIALEEHGLLETLITDAYDTATARAVSAVIPGMASTLATRRAREIPDQRVQCLWSTTVHEHLRHRLGYSKRSTWLMLDRKFGQAAADVARRTRANLLMYSPYAWEAFTASYSHNPRRVLFQYHPHPDLEARLLAEDASRFPGYGESFAEGGGDVVPQEWLNRERDSWRHADAIICSSSFTRRSLVEAGCDPAICHVVPYGVFEAAPVQPSVASTNYQVLFVGSGGQRKGLHHLLMAWQLAVPRADWRLTIVSRAIDRGVRELARRTSNVQIIEGATDAQLDELYASSTLFAMPSMVEGFGHVYLEALARGCPVLGTPNTALPDLGGAADGIYIVPAGDLETLAERLRALASTLPGNSHVRRAAKAAADRYPWSRFRAELMQAIQA